jgi:hypothetical protein
MLKLVITRPSYETTTKYLFAWNQKVIKTAKIKSVETTDLSKQYATKRNLTDALFQSKPDLVFLNGHGAPDMIAGQDNEILIKAGINEDILKGKHVHALSCETGKILGPAAVSIGAKSYIGYKEPFVFIASKGKAAKPLSDKRASLFLDPAIEVSLSLLNGDSPTASYKNSQKATLKTIRALAASGKKDSFLLRYLFWNLKHQVCLLQTK